MPRSCFTPALILLHIFPSAITPPGRLPIVVRPGSGHGGVLKKKRHNKLDDVFNIKIAKRKLYKRAFLSGVIRIQLWNGDCFEVMGNIPDGSVDMVLCDLPYGVLNKENPNAQWDCPLWTDALWADWSRVCKENAAIVLFGQGMFTADLMKSNPVWWRYNLVWKKGNRPTGFLDANRKPLRIHEDILIFYQTQPTYNPQFTTGELTHSRGKVGNGGKSVRNSCYGEFLTTPANITHEKYPVSVIDIPKEHPQQWHPTQKPVALLEWLIRTYTNDGETVLDNCMGSGSTGVACVNTGRDFIGIEIDPQYFAVAQKRIAEAQANIAAQNAQCLIDGWLN